MVSMNCPHCLGCPSHGAIFKKMYNRLKAVMFGAMMIVKEGANSSHYIHTRFCGDKFKLHYHKLMQTDLGLIVSK